MEALADSTQHRDDLIRRLTDVEEERATLRARLATVEKERDEARESEGRLLARREPLDPSGYSLADAEFILMDHLKGMTIEDRSESLKRIGETESHALRSALLSAERDWRDATAERDCLRALLTEACGKLAGYVGHRRGVLLHIEATCEDDADLAGARRELKALDAEAGRLAAIAREGGVE